MFQKRYVSAAWAGLVLPREINDYPGGNPPTLMQLDSRELRLKWVLLNAPYLS